MGRMIGDGLITRLWNCYGAEEPSQRNHMILDLIVQGKTGTIRLLTSGEERRQFLHADDVADALIVQREGEQPLADVTSGTWVSIRKIAELIGEQLNAKMLVGQSRGYESLVNSSHLVDRWKPRVDLPTGLGMVIQRISGNHWT